MTEVGAAHNLYLHLSLALFNCSECKNKPITWLTSFNQALCISCLKGRKASRSCRAWKNPPSLVSHCVQTAVAWRGSNLGELFTWDGESRLWITCAFATCLELYLQLWLIVKEKLCVASVFSWSRENHQIHTSKTKKNAQRSLTDVTFFPAQKSEQRLKPQLLYFSTGGRKDWTWAVHKMYLGMWPMRLTSNI